MVRNYKRKTEDKWSKESLLEALTLLKDGKKKIFECALEYKISRATLYRHVKKMNVEGTKYLDMRRIKKCGGNPILSSVEEDVLETTVKGLLTEGYTVTPIMIKRICYEYCERNGIPTRFSVATRLASDDWYYGFIKRHPDLKSSKQKENVTRQVIHHDMKMKEETESPLKSQDSPMNSENEASTGVATPLKKPLKRLKVNQNRGGTKGAVSSSMVLGQLQDVSKGRMAEDGCANLKGGGPEKMEDEAEEVKSEDFADKDQQTADEVFKNQTIYNPAYLLVGDSFMEESAAVKEEDGGAEYDEESRESEEESKDDDEFIKQDDDGDSGVQEEESTGGDFEECVDDDDSTEGDDDDENGVEEETEKMETDDENGAEEATEEMEGGDENGVEKENEETERHENGIEKDGFQQIGKASDFEAYSISVMDDSFFVLPTLQPM